MPTTQRIVNPLWIVALQLACSALMTPATASAADRPAARPNILLAISDDQSWPYASAYGTTGVRTPAFDRVAQMGVLFKNAFCASPGCAPSRAALLTGRNCWELEAAGTHDSSFPKSLAVYPELLQQAGYYVGSTAKGWGPGNWQTTGRGENPAGKPYNGRTLEKSSINKGILNNDYAGNFDKFLDAKPKDAPFCFWFGCKEPHRSFEAGAGRKAGKQLADAFVPPFLPDNEAVRSDVLDYCTEIEWFDKNLGRMLDLLEKSGQLHNTLIVITSDNGMPFPRAKANNYEYGLHMPLAICWADRIPGQRHADDLASFVDIAPTLLAAAGVSVPKEMRGRSLLGMLESKRSGLVDPTRTRVFASRERHSSARYNNWGYPSRALRTADYLYVRNFHPERWPAGDPRDAKGEDAYYDIDASPTKSLLIAGRASEPLARYFHLAVDKRPAEELFDLHSDPATITNVAGESQYASTLEQLRGELNAYLAATGDPRSTSAGEVFETYPRFSAVRKFPTPE